jgi:bifunctional non-homologous end joining protein LigD
MQRRIDQRGSRVYVDTGQTGRRRTIVAPYSVRAFPGATVSTPVAWEEMNLALDPRRFSLRTVPERIKRLGDPMRPLLHHAPDLAASVELLAALAGVGPRS